MKAILCIAVILGNATTAFGQSMPMAKVENDLQAVYKKVFDFGSQKENLDSLEYYDSLFAEKMSYYTAAYPATLTYPFDSLRRSVYIVSSQDTLFRIYSWDRWDGGTMHNFDNVFQYRFGDKVYSHLVVDTATGRNFSPGSFYSQIYTLKADSEVYYLCIGNSIYSSRDAAQSIEVFSVDGPSGYRPANIFKTKQGLQSTINVEFNFFSVVGRPERPLRLIQYSSPNKTVYIPVVSKKGDVENSYISYRFDGKYFVFAGIIHRDKSDSENAGVSVTSRN